MSEQKPRKSKFSLFGLLFDLVLLAAGAGVYAIHFIWKLPVTMTPLFVNLVGGLDNAFYIVSGLLVAGGVWGLIATALRLAKK